MTLKPRKSLSRLAHLFHRTSPRQPDSSHLIWILLASACRGPQYSDIYDARVQDLVNVLTELKQVHSVQRLNNTSPACSLTGTLASSPRTSPVSLLVQVDGKTTPLRSTVVMIEDILENSTVINERGRIKILYYSLSAYELSHAYSPRRSRAKTGRCMVTVAIEPSLGQDEDIDAWYRKEHLAMLASNSLYLRCNRYERVSSDPVGISRDSSGAKFVAMHEYTSVQDLFDHSIKKGPIVPETDWTRHILDNAKSVERTIWTIYEPSTGPSG